MVRPGLAGLAEALTSAGRGEEREHLLRAEVVDGL